MTTEGLKQKLTAILSADVKDYSRLLSQDRVSTINTLKSHRDLFSELIKQYGGRVIDTPGDNILAAFESISDAVNCAVEIQRTLAERNDEVPSARKMQWRIGVNLGDVVEDEGRIYGDGVNIAARVEGMAEPGSICISGSVYDQVQDTLGLEFEYQGEKEVKNIVRPIRIYGLLIKSKSKIESVKENRILPSDRPSIAVLPFVNMSNDPEQEYFSDGMSEEIINGLAKNPGLIVKGRTSSFSDKIRNQDIKTIADLLNVTHVVEGSVRKSGYRIRITAQLIDTAKDAHLWSDKYDRELTDVFEIQDDISAAILKELNIRLTGSSHKQNRTDNIEAYNAYLLGRYQIERMQLDKAAASFEKAISLDPNFVHAYGMLANVHNLDIWTMSKPAREKWPIIRGYIDKTLSLNPNQSGALMTKLEISFYEDHDYQDIINKVADFVRQYPNDINILSFYTRVLRTIGRTDLAIRIHDHIVELDPLSPLMQGERGRTYLADGYYDEARESFERCEMLGDNQSIMFANIAFWEEDAKALQRILDRDWPDWVVVGRQCHKAALSYLKGDHKKVKETLVPVWQTTSYISFVQKTQMAFLERDLDLAFDYYEQALSESDYTAFLLARAKYWAKSVYRDMYSHPRYQKMLRKVGLDDESVAKLKIPPLPF